MQENIPPPDTLPQWLQALLYIGGVLGAAAAAWKGWVNKNKPSEAHNAIIAGDIMSTKPMKDLADEVGRLKNSIDRIPEGQDRIIDAINRLNDSERATETSIRDLCRATDRGTERIVDTLQSNQTRARSNG